MNEYLSHGRALLQPFILSVGEFLDRPPAEVELMIFSSIATLLVVLTFSILTSRSGPVAETCCVTKLMQARKASKLPGVQSIPSSIGSSDASNPNLEAFIRDVQQQLGSIRNEIQILKHEREIVDHELIETSTQILQTIGATFNALTEENEEVSELELPKIIKPVPSRPTVQRPVIELTPAKPQHAPQPDSPVLVPSQPKISAKPVIPSPNMQPVPKSQPQSKAPPSQPPVSAVSPRSVPAPASVTNSPIVKPQAPPNNPQVPQKAAPKMSAIAAARLKREQELAESKGPTAPVAASNPFAKPKSGPFGAPTVAKVTTNGS